MLTEDFENNLPRAGVVNGGLVLSFPNALTPVLWRHSLGTMDDIAFQLLFEGKLAILVIKTSTGHMKEIARFASIEEGQKAFHMANDALFAGGHGLLSDGSGANSGSSMLMNIIVFVLMFAILIGGGYYYYQQKATRNVVDYQPQQYYQDEAAPSRDEDQASQEDENAFAPGVAVDVDKMFGE